jgi:hypothetical protein
MLAVGWGAVKFCIVDNRWQTDEKNGGGGGLLKRVISFLEAEIIVK